MMKPIILLLCALLISVAACDQTRKSEIVIYNKSAFVLKDILVNDGKVTWKVGDLLPSRQVVFRHQLNGEDSGTISWLIQGNRITAKTCYYAKNFPIKGDLYIYDRNVTFKCSNAV
jgi:hypothetical protein